MAARAPTSWTELPKGTDFSPKQEGLATPWNNVVNDQVYTSGQGTSYPSKLICADSFGVVLSTSGAAKSLSYKGLGLHALDSSATNWASSGVRCYMYAWYSAGATGTKQVKLDQVTNGGTTTRVVNVTSATPTWYNFGNALDYNTDGTPTQYNVIVDASTGSGTVYCGAFIIYLEPA